MAQDLNSVVIVGRLTREPEIKYTPSGTALAHISVANGERTKQNNEWKDYTNYFDVTVWGNSAVNCQKFLHKGSQVAVSGRLRQDRWEDKTTGKTVSKVQIIADSVQFLGSPAGNNNGGQFNQQYQGQPQGNTGYNSQPQMNNPYQNGGQPQSMPVNNMNPWDDAPAANGGSRDYYAETFAQPDNFAGSDDDIPF